MWTRKELKAKGKETFLANYWKTVLVSLVFALTVGSSGYGGSGANTGDGTEYVKMFENGWQGALEYPLFFGITLGMILMIGAVLFVVGIFLKIFLLNSLNIGCSRFFVNNLYEKAELSEMGYGFSNQYMNGVSIMFLRDLYTFLWSLLFIIPGIVKSYEYRMIPYLLAENPNMTREEAFRESKRMMDGNKWDAFVLDLSFVLWYLLSGITFGILAVFYVGPYVNQTNAALYDWLKLHRYQENLYEKNGYQAEME